MRKRPETEPVNFRFPTDIKRWLKSKSKRTRRSQTKLVLDALIEQYGLKGRSA